MMKSVSAGDQRASDDSRSKSDSVDGEKVKLRRMDSQFKITTPDKDCKVLHNLFTPAAMVGVPDAVLTPREEIKDKVCTN